MRIGFSLKTNLDILIVKSMGYIGALMIKLLMCTLRISIEGQEKLDAIHVRGGKVIYTFWHGQMLILTYTHRNNNIHIVISNHRDGEIIAQITKRLGFSSIRGSTTRGGAKVILNILTKLNNKYDIAITPDGPKGPRCKVQPGVIYIAQKTGLPIVPFVNGTDSFWELQTWDRFRVPKPFSRALIIYGDPIIVPAELDREGIALKSLELEEKLHSLSRELDERLSVIETGK
ncbi:MAG: lysophospholipid acyltransferase family protein [Candidatus Glassbacteria bacterium]